MEEFDNDKKTGKLIQSGYRFKVKKCFQKEAEECIEEINFFYRYKSFGFPYAGGWAYMPSYLLKIIEILDVENSYKRVL